MLCGLYSIATTPTPHYCNVAQPHMHDGTYDAMCYF